MEADCPGLLVELARPDEALERAGRLAAALEVTGETHALVWLRASSSPPASPAARPRP